MTAAELVNTLRELGVEAIAEGSRLRLRPASKIPEPLRQELTARRRELLALLADPCPECGSGPGVLLCRRCGRGVAESERFLATVPESVRREPPSSGGPPVYRRPPFEERCARCKDLAARGVVILACSHCDISRGRPNGAAA